MQGVARQGCVGYGKLRLGKSGRGKSGFYGGNGAARVFMNVGGFDSRRHQYPCNS